MNGREIKYCKLCVMPSSRPRIHFNDNGICNACVNANEKDLIDIDMYNGEIIATVEKINRK